MYSSNIQNLRKLTNNSKRIKILHSWLTLTLDDQIQYLQITNYYTQLQLLHLSHLSTFVYTLPSYLSNSITEYSVMPITLLKAVPQRKVRENLTYEIKTVVLTLK